MAPPGRPAATATTLTQRPVPSVPAKVIRHPWLALRRRPIPGTRRHGLAAGQVAVAMALCFGLWTLLSAHTLRKSAEASPVGKRRTAALVVLRPLDGLSHLMFVDRLAGLLQRAAGHDPNKVTPGGGILADGPPPSEVETWPVGVQRSSSGVAISICGSGSLSSTPFSQRLNHSNAARRRGLLYP